MNTAMIPRVCSSIIGAITVSLLGRCVLSILPGGGNGHDGTLRDNRVLLWGIVKIIVPFWVPLIRPRILIGTQKGTIILTIPHILLLYPFYRVGGSS